MHRKGSAFLGIVLLLWGAAASVAADLSDGLTGYTLTSWTRRDGLPPGPIFALAQDKDGYLWVGTNAGVSRFDGFQFVQWAAADGQLLPRQPVRALLGSRDGSIWIGFAAPGGITRIDGRRIHSFGPSRGLGRSDVNFITEDAEGGIWAGDEEGVYRLDGDRWVRMGPEQGLPAEQGTSAYSDGSGALFVGMATGLFRRAPGESHFTRVESADEPTRSMAVDGLGHLWVTDPIVGLRPAGQASALSRMAQRARGRRLLYDRVGNLWLATGGQGLWRVQFRPVTHDVASIERAQSSMGLPADGILALLEDREGNIWAGTADGLSRLTRHSVTPLPTAGLVSTIDATPDGHVWVATTDGLLRYDAPRVDHEPTRIWAPASGLRALHVDADGTVWAATEHELVRFVSGRLTAVDFGRDAALRQISLLTSGPDRGLLIYDLEQGLLVLTSDGLRSVMLSQDLAATRVVSLFTEREGRMWVAFADGRLATIEPDGFVRVFDLREQLASGLPRTFLQDRKGDVWIGGTLGLRRYRNGQFVTFGRDQGFDLGPVTSVAEDDDGMLWVGTTLGIARLDPKQCDALAQQGPGRLPYRLLDRSDGLAGIPVWFGTRAAVRSRDGDLWFVTSSGVTVVRPSEFTQAATPSPIQLQSVMADGRLLPVVPSLRLPPRPSRVEIAYGRLDLTSPQRTRFRYQLEGVDRHWVEADGQRRVEYQDLPPGTYRFRVEATAGDGAWPEPSATWAFVVPPIFYQTWWFRGLCLVALAGMVWAAWQLRLRQLNARFEGLLGERLRLSRVIHDTLLQSLVGVAFQCDAIAADLSDLAPENAERFVRMRHQVQDYIREARQSIWELRSQRLEGTDFPTAFRKLCEHVIADRAVALEFTVTGTVRQSSDRVGHQLMLIGQEAVLNAVRHGHASLVRVELDYSPSTITLRVSDDGHGFNVAAVNYEIAGHYGLSTMRERAQDLGGGFTISSGLGRGTAVEAVVPAL